jgi:hypothetical protein
MALRRAKPPDQVAITFPARGRKRYPILTDLYAVGVQADLGAGRLGIRSVMPDPA